jgi:hypothetical protein
MISIGADDDDRRHNLFKSAAETPVTGCVSARVSAHSFCRGKADADDHEHCKQWTEGTAVRSMPTARPL